MTPTFQRIRAKPVKWIHEFHVASHSKLGASHCRNDIRYSYLLTHVASDGHSSRAQSVASGRAT